jgi:hypothetical protein
MKILLFNLGSIEHRIIAWDIESYRPIFKHEVVIWGPVPDEKFSFDGKEIPIIRLTEPTSIIKIFKQLPEGWLPDIVTCDTSVLNYVQDMHLCPVKTILFTRDAWADTIFNKKLVEIFDFISHSIVDISAYLKFKINILPLAGFPVSIPDSNSRIPDYEKRKIDIIAIANYDDAFYHNRYKTLYKLAESNRGLKIKYYKGLKRNEIHDYYRSSKMVIDWSHTLSNRSYEAALNGCLLFSHEDNSAMNSFWIPGVEYVAYNESNLLDLVEFYTTNITLAKKIIENAVRKINSMPVGFGEYMMESISLAFEINIDIDARIESINMLNDCDLSHRTATPLIYNYRYDTNFPLNWQEIYFKRIDNALSKTADSGSKIVPLIEAGRIAFLLNKYELSNYYLDVLEKLLPYYAWIYYLKGRISFEQNDFAQALLYANKAINFCIESPDLITRYVLPVIEKGKSADGRRITDFLWQSVYNHNNDFQVSAFLNMAFELSGDINQKTGDNISACSQYCQAVNYLPLPVCVKKAAHLLIKSDEKEKLREVTEKGTLDSPYDSVVVLYNAYYLILSGQKIKAFKLLKGHRNALKSFTGIRRLLYIRYFINIILFFVFWSRKISRNLVLETIKVVNK